MPSFRPRSLLYRLINPILPLLSRLGVTPNALTVIGTVGSIGAAVLIGFGFFLPGGLLLLAFSSLDMLDGALARATGSVTPFGGVLDSVMDRVSEGAVLLGLLIYFSARSDQQETILVFLAILGSMLVSYTRARAELAGTLVREGYATRPERVLLIVAGLIIQGVSGEGLTVVLWILAVLANLTAVQRLFLAWQKSRNRG